MTYIDKTTGQVVFWAKKLKPHLKKGTNQPLRKLTRHKWRRQPFLPQRRQSHIKTPMYRKPLSWHYQLSSSWYQQTLQSRHQTAIAHKSWLQPFQRTRMEPQFSSFSSERNKDDVVNLPVIDCTYVVSVPDQKTNK